MSLSEKIENDFLTAYKSHEELKISVLRLIKSALKNAEIAKKDSLNDDDVVLVLKREAKQRRESIEAYSAGNQTEMAEKEEKELKIIGTLANDYNTVIIEDLAYFGMDFREKLGTPGIPPFQPTVRKYTDQCILLLSGSKIFSYAGQRIGLMAIPDKLLNSHYQNLNQYFGTDEFGHSVIYGALYALSAGTAHSAQYSMAAMLKAASDGDFKFVEEISEYEKRAHVMKKLFTDSGFYLVYDKDEDKHLGDGFYFTVN